MDELQDSLEQEMSLANLKMTLDELSKNHGPEYMLGWLDGFSYADNEWNEREKAKSQIDWPLGEIK